MKSTLNETKNGVLNESTNTIHRHKTGASELKTECGLTDYVPRGHLRRMSVDLALATESANKCGRCFPGAGGY